MINELYFCFINFIKFIDGEHETSVTKRRIEFVKRYVLEMPPDKAHLFQIIGKAGKIVRLVRIMRIMRIFKMVRHFAGLQVRHTKVHFFRVIKNFLVKKTLEFSAFFKGKPMII